MGLSYLLFSLYSFVLVSILDLDKSNQILLADVFRDSKYCEWESCPLNLRNSKVVGELLRNALKMYRNELHIDGIRWITRYGDRVLGGSCSTPDLSDAENDSLLQDFWVDLKSLGFIIVSSIWRIHSLVH